MTTVEFGVWSGGSARKAQALPLPSAAIHRSAKRGAFARPSAHQGLRSPDQCSTPAVSPDASHALLSASRRAVAFAARSRRKAFFSAARARRASSRSRRPWACRPRAQGWPEPTWQFHRALTRSKFPFVASMSGGFVPRAKTGVTRLSSSQPSTAAVSPWRRHRGRWKTTTPALNALSRAASTPRSRSAAMAAASLQLRNVPQTGRSRGTAATAGPSAPFKTASASSATSPSAMVSLSSQTTLVAAAGSSSPR